ncbi:hypothetical protein AB0933_21735 [Streptomyces venezuelae]|uniref:hypothetical protein n=1 Tax=Streptomyces venezuelae TaxID=54571 RepID=UPI003452613D
MASQAIVEAGRLSAIVKILDRAGGHLSAAVRDHTRTPALPGDPEASALQALLDLSRSAAHELTCAVQHAGSGDLGLAQAHLEAARTAPEKHVVPTAGMPFPLPAGVRTALQLLRGITGFFSKETEDALVRALTITSAPAA